MASKILLSFDIEEFDLPREKGEQISLEEGVAVSDEGLKKILKILKKKNVRATFFTTGNFARLKPNSVRAIVEAGHEVAAHGVDHFEPSNSDIGEAKIILERTLKGIHPRETYRVKGWRQPRMQRIDFAKLARQGYLYDSSINPAFIPGRYNHFHTPRVPYNVRCNSNKTSIRIADRVVEIPTSVATWLRLPMFWLAMHNYPFSLYLRLARSSIKHSDYFATYFHPWEFTDLTKYPVVPGFIRRNCNDKLCDRLEKLITELKKDGHEFVTYREFAEAYEN